MVDLFKKVGFMPKNPKLPIVSCDNGISETGRISHEKWL